jgi:hypothetical protein
VADEQGPDGVVTPQQVPASDDGDRMHGSDLDVIRSSLSHAADGEARQVLAGAPVMGVDGAELTDAHAHDDHGTIARGIGERPHDDRMIDSSRMSHRSTEGASGAAVRSRHPGLLVESRLLILLVT